jgi:hypothetical protein
VRGEKKERARDEISNGGPTLGGKTKFPPARDFDRSYRHGDGHPANTSPPVKDLRQKRARLPRKGSALAPRGLRGAGAMIACLPTEPVRARTERPTVRHRKASPRQEQKNEVAPRDGALRSEHPRSHDGIEIARDGHAAVLKRLSHETARAADASRTRKVAFPGRRLHVGSPTGPGTPGPEPRRTPCVVLPEAILRGTKYRNARFAPNFRHHTVIGGHRIPWYAPTPVSTPPGPLLDARRRGHFFAIFGGRISPSCQARVC